MAWLEVAVGKFYDWRQRYGRVHEHNGWAPRNFWLEPWEKAAIIDFQGSIPPSFLFGGRFYFSKGEKLMTVTEHPRLLARAAGVFYLIIIGFALFAYKYVRGQLLSLATWLRPKPTFWRMSASIDWAIRPPSWSSSAICPRVDFIRAAQSRESAASLARPRFHYRGSHHRGR
jgi:hypothetical protein